MSVSDVKTRLTIRLTAGNNMDPFVKTEHQFHRALLDSYLHGILRWIYIFARDISQERTIYLTTSQC